MRRESNCQGCGLLLVFDDAAQSILHEEPVCPWFESVLAQANEKPEVRRVSREAVPAHLDALAARVARKKETS